ncbi:DUF3348 family protein [Stenotrophomonas maltophilia]|uniref:DUF3348 family protein n=1 Tax=Stenotrophomonas TaxID=40323 RepID=UPI00130FB744|nr:MULTISPECIES: DUF3348 family protein [Stenotrophomonas]ELC7320891.1 DUF3348 domain-containing protein [Stenotrophomonas maltophilia]MBA0275447.1 DUF3348 family protein [Stenotrophomonas maltophilia]MBA0410852.1 DUF3348 family protein [Stenotrophomonas maltophilia]MBA0500077.1 DUF3348 family protein [Stenotrophomonas maltophilia]MBA0500905.1 DUF3348 family protein [Stenotrophomonas maltophilia]
MAKAAQPVLGGPEFLRLLARLSDGAMPASSPALTDRLGQWVDWSRAVALSRALGGRLPEPGEATEAAGDVLNDCAQAHASLLASISEDAEAERLLDLAEAAAAPNFASLRQRYRVLQQAIQTATGRLRGRLRDQLVQVSPELARLAEVDAVMEQTLTPREHSLLATAPAVLGARFERVHGQPGWRASFRHDMRTLLLAELQLRFHPIEGLQDALRSH